MSVPTMKDVAKEAGVALGTVSKVFNDIPVGESYRRRVMDAAEKMGYQVNSYARGLKTNRTYAVALIVPNITIPFFSAFAQNICQSLARRGYRMILSVTDFDSEAEQRCIRMAKQNRVDGIIGLTYHPSLALDGSIPYVSFDRYFGSGIPCVASDNFGGGRMAAEKLFELGCRHPVFFRIGSAVPGESDKRRDGFESFCREKQIPCQTLWLCDEDGYEPFQAFLREHMPENKPDFDGIFCSTDALACMILPMLKELGIRIPEDVQVIGFDGIPDFFNGKLPCSTIIQPVRILAETAVDMLLKPDRNTLPCLTCLPVRYASGCTTRDGQN